MFRITSVLSRLLDFLLPRTCIVCNDEIEKGLLCDNCINYLPQLGRPLCRRCGRPIKKGQICRFCKTGVSIEHGRAWSIYVPPVDKIIHHFKYRSQTSLAGLIGRGMSNVIKADYILNQTDYLVPVPLYWWKRLKRGYNQARLLADVISGECHIPMLDALRRIKNTRSQTRLDAESRRRNVRNAFALKDERINNKNILLVDDVLTTGATINECARVLKQAGAKNVYACVAAITPT